MEMEPFEKDIEMKIAYLNGQRDFYRLFKKFMALARDESMRQHLIDAIENISAPVSTPQDEGR